MHEQEFEKTVQSRLEELSFQPSDPVWDKVASAIQTRKRRRVIFWLLPLIMLSTGAAFLFFPLDFTEIEKASFHPAKTDTAFRGKKKVAIATNKEEKINKSERVASETHMHTVPEKQLTQKQKSLNEASRVEQSLAGLKRNNFPGAVNSNTEISNSLEVIFGETKPEKEKRSVAPALHPIWANKLNALKETQPSPLPFTVNVPAVAKAALAKKWQWGLSIQGGRATVTEKGSQSGVFFQDRFNTPGQSPVPVTGNSGPVVYPQIKSIAGFFFSGGLTLTRHLYGKWSLQSGMQYALYTQRLGVGEKVNSAAVAGNISDAALQSRNLYRANSHTQYIANRFHQVALPLNLQYKPLARVPLTIEAGLAAAYIAGGKQVQYDTASRLFFEKKAQLQPIQWMGNAGISYRVGQGKKWQWLAAAQVRYHFTHLYQQSMQPARLSAFSAGLHIRRK